MLDLFEELHHTVRRTEFSTDDVFITSKGRWFLKINVEDKPFVGNGFDCITLVAVSLHHGNRPNS